MDISFYSKSGAVDHVDVPEELFSWLAKSEFSKIGTSRARRLVVDGESVLLPLVELSKVVRSKLEGVVCELIASRIETISKKLGSSPSGREAAPLLRELYALVRILRGVQSRQSRYLQRVPE